MKLKKIEVQSLRVFKNALLITDLDPGINVFAGRNGIGKTSLAAALRSAFFERAKSDKTKHLKPLDDPGASPRVSLSWDFDGTAYELTKEFAPKRRCTLIAGPQALDGEEAEDHLATLFGYSYAGKGLNRDENLGVPGLLWIEQGTGQNLLDPVSFAGEHLKTAVASIAGVVASTAGDAVIDRLYVERDALVTRAQGRATGDYAKAIADADAESARLRDLGQEISEYRDCVDDLSKVEAERKKLDSEKPWQALDTQAAEAKSALDAANDLQGKIEEQRGKLAHADNMLPLIESRIAQLESAATAQAELQGSVQSSTAELEDLRASVDPTRKVAEEAERDEVAARAAMAAARSRAKAASLQATIASASKAKSSQDAALKRARAAHQERVELAAKLGASPIRQADIDALRALEDKLRETDIQIDAVGTRLQYEIDASTTATLDGESINGAGDAVIEVAAEFISHGVKLTIEPGGSDLAVLLDSRTDASNQLRNALDRHGVPSAEELVRRHQEHERVKTQDSLAQATLQSAAPEGIEALELEWQTSIAAIESAQAELSQLTEITEGASLSEDEASLQWNAANDASRAARERLLSIKAVVQQAEESHARLVAELKAATDRVNDPARINELATSRQDHLTQADIAKGARDRIRELEGQLETAQPHLLENDYERLTKSAANLRQRLTALNVQTAELSGLAKGKGAKGLEEQRAEAEVKLAALERRRDEMAHRVKVVAYLLEKLEKRKEQARQNLLEPLQKRVDHYVRMFMPDVNIALSDEMAPEQITSLQDKHNKGAFLEQSFGTREQLSLICRLAYADILKQAGRPTLIILDDALVHSDDDRLSSMKRVIYDAATRHQMLVFTCHPSRWQDMGVSARDFSEMVRASA